jgi:hypothetical protein
MCRNRMSNWFWAMKTMPAVSPPVVPSPRTIYRDDYPHLDLGSWCYALVELFEKGGLINSRQTIQGVPVTMERGWPPGLTLITGIEWSIYFGEDESYIAYVYSEDQFLSDLQAISLP